VIGLAGGYPVPPTSSSDGSGGFGNGAIGVKGQGNKFGMFGQGHPHEGKTPAAGVMGVSGPLLGIDPTALSGTGVIGWGLVGVRGMGFGDRGAEFASDQSPQLNLVPSNISGPSKLTGVARAGDLLVTSEKDPKTGVETAKL
jgi:hypothetical protein